MIAAIKEIARLYHKEKISQRAASLAFYALISLAPLLIIIISLGSFLLGADILKTEILIQVENALGSEFRDFLTRFFENLTKENRAAYGIASIVVLVYGATHLFDNAHSTLKSIFGRMDQEKATQRFIHKHVIAFIYIGIAMAVLLLLSLANIAMAIFLDAFYVGSIDPGVFQVATFLISLALATVLFSFVYRYVSDKTLSWQASWSGGFVAAFLVAILSLLFNVYMQLSVILSAYGASFFIVAFLLLSYYLSIAVLVGALIAKKAA